MEAVACIQYMRQCNILVDPNAKQQAHSAEFDAERRAFSKLEIKRIRQQQAHDAIEADMMAKLEARDATLSGERYTA